MARHKQWNEEECKKSSTCRELSAIEFALESFIPIVQGSYIKWFSDNQVTTYRHRANKNTVDSKGRTGKADFISRTIDINDWQISHG